MKKLLTLLVLFLFTACSNECENELNIDAEKKEILSIMRTQQDGWNEGDWEKYMSGYKKSESIRFAGGGKVTFGWQKVLDNYKKGYPDKSAMGILTFSNQDVMVLSLNSAIVFGNWHLKREKDEPWGEYTLLWEKTKKGWKIVHDHSSSSEN